MDEELMEQLQDLIDALRVAGAQAQQVAQSPLPQRLNLGPEHERHADEIMDLIRKVEQLRLLAEKAGGEP